MEIITALHAINKNKMARKFLKTMARSDLSEENFIRIGALSSKMGYTDITVYIARRAARKGIFLMQLGYPIIKHAAFPFFDKQRVLSAHPNI